jgi:hypothetical protein
VPHDVDDPSVAGRRTTSLVPSVLALSTTTIAVGSGSVAALRHSAASPSGSLRASLRAGTTISKAVGPVTADLLSAAWITAE